MEKYYYGNKTQAKPRLIEAFKEIGVIAPACKKAGISRTTFYRWINEDGSFLTSIINAFEELYKDPIKRALLDQVPEHKRHFMYL
jgi:hypothetical protein